MVLHQARQLVDRRAGINPRHALMHCVLYFTDGSLRAAPPYSLQRTLFEAGSFLTPWERTGDKAVTGTGTVVVRSNINGMRWSP
jgi:hypothetical protein